MNKLVRKALKSTTLLYFILFLAIVNIVGYLSMGQFDAVVVFAIIGFVAQSFSKNMIMILVIPLIATALYVTLFKGVREGFKEGAKGDKGEKDKKKIVEDHNPPKKNCPEGQIRNTKGKCSKEKLTQLHPQWIKDEERTEEEFYKSVDDNVPDLGIQDMADKTSQLIEKQKKLRSSMDKILPLVDQTNKFMDSINFDKLTGVLGGLNSNN
tara:strand:- start:1548 stop:2177 length:630 start_codon:yes stop_codon:yes gene_type:complete